ncbi:MAG: hypothetical protein CMO12_04650 [Thaumarchaeota archaeon]|nr:hypothetical protein [Nitrososphaerota archaeon]
MQSHSGNLQSQYERITERYRPEPPTSLELKYMKDFEDPAELSIFYHKLELIAVEGREIFTKMGAAPLIASGDLVAGIMTSNGDMAVCSTGTYLHAASTQFALKYILDHFVNDPTVGIADGDIWFVNEALYGVTHNVDMYLYLPVFFKGKLIAWTFAGAHEPDAGGIGVGMSPHARTRYDEGLKIPPIKIGENFELKRDLMAMIENQVRDPRTVTLDTKAKVAACMRIRSRLLEIADRRGEGHVIGGLRRVLTLIAEAAKKRVASFNDGIYRHTMFLDNTGSRMGLIRLSVAIKKKGEKITVDCSGTSPQTEGAYNCLKHQVVVASSVKLFNYLFGDFPGSGAVFDPFEYVVPRGTVLNSDPENAVALGIITVGRWMSAFWTSFAKMMYDSDYQDLVTASLGHRNTKHTPISGINQYGLQQVWELVETVNANGQGGRANSDGENACVYHFSPSADTLDVELQETQLPILYLFRNLMPDNHGFGKHRGGTGVQFGVMLHNVPSFTAIARGQGSKFPIDTGLFGGYAGGTGPAISVRNTNLKKLLKDSDMDIPRGIAELLEKRHIKGDYSITEPNMYWTMREGDLIANYSSSGAGFGDPLERDPEDVLRDLRQGIISFKVSQEVYKVVFSNRHSLQLDLKKTAKARKKARQARLETALPYHEFIMEWSKKRPPAEAMATLGPWPKKA